MECNTNIGIDRIALVGNYLPRKCGIATFTTDLAEAIASKYPKIDCFTLAMNDQQAGYDYLPRVRFEIPQDQIFSYKQAAEFLKQHEVDVINLQHEFGIFGGPAGSHLLNLLKNLTTPVVTTLHTVLKEPDPIQLKVMGEITRLSDRLVVMSQRAVNYLTDIYKVPQAKIDRIPHGIPDIPFIDPSFYKDQFGVEGKTVLLTFGLLSRNKGIENVILALPEIVKQHPNVVYIVLGATHPHVLQQEGEQYREYLQTLAEENGVGGQVIFHNQFVEIDELVKYIGAADIYITPYLNPAQIVSGTLAYTVGAGKAVISTPYWYAKELLADGRGLLVPFRDPQAIAEQVLFLLNNEAERHAMRKRAYLFGREMIWSEVADRYIESFLRARQEHMERRRLGALFTGWNEYVQEQTEIKLDHVLRMTDDTGILQHAVYSMPNRFEGYTTDDNARALIAAIYLEELGLRAPEELDLASRYLAFLNYAFNPETGRFRNFMRYDRSWMEETGSEDSHGRSLWSLGTVIGRSSREGLFGPAIRLFEQALPAVLKFRNPRPWAFALLGIHEYLKKFPGDRTVVLARQQLVDSLLDLYRSNCSPDWLWFEDSLTYCNPVLSRALLLSGQGMGRQELIEVGLESLAWLVSVQLSEDGHLTPIGCNGFYVRGGEKARYDQQPVEAFSMVAASLDAYRVTAKTSWSDIANLALRWFYGYNDLGLPLYDPQSGGCRDGLKMDRLNQNQGAESTLAYLLSAIEMRAAFEQEHTPPNGKNPAVQVYVPTHKLDQ